MPSVQTAQTTCHYIYGIDIRDKNFPELTYDSGTSDSPTNWGGKLSVAKPYPSYQDAWNRLQQLYKANRASLVGISFGILTTKDTTQINIQSTEERYAEILGKFNVPAGN